MDIVEIQSGIAKVWQIVVRQMSLLAISIFIAAFCFNVLAMKEKLDPQSSLAKMIALAKDKDLTNFLTTFGIAPILPIVTLFLFLSILQLHEMLVRRLGSLIPPELWTSGFAIGNDDDLKELWRRERDGTTLDVFLSTIEAKASDRFWKERRKEGFAEGYIGSLNTSFQAAKFFFLFALALPYLAKLCGVSGELIALNFRHDRQLLVLILAALAAAYWGFRYFDAIRNEQFASSRAVVLEALSAGKPRAAAGGDEARAELADKIEERDNRRWWLLHFDVLGVINAARNWSVVKRVRLEKSWRARARDAKSAPPKPLLLKVLERISR